MEKAVKGGAEVTKAPETNEVKTEKGVSLTDKIRENPWIVSTLVLGILVVIFLVSDLSGSTTGAYGAVADKADVQAKVMEFVNSQVTEPVEVVSTEVKNGLYEIVVKYQGNDIPIYATLDGANLVQGVTPIDTLLAAADTQDTGATDTATTNIPKSDKPVVELFVMSMCPYGTQAEKGILSVVELLKDKIDFKLRFVSYAMHGKNEVDENTVQYCIQKNEPTKFYDYLKCYLKSSDPASWKACRAEVGISEAKLSSCITATDKEFKITELYNDQTTWSGGRYPQFNVDKALTDKYSVGGSPTLIINGIQSSAGRSSASYLSAICAAFNTAPSECSTAVSSASPSPGFGWETTGTASGSAAAQCG